MIGGVAHPCTDLLNQRWDLLKIIPHRRQPHEAWWNMKRVNAFIHRTMGKWVSLALWLAVCFAAAGMGSWITAPALRDWYPALRKPPWTPPDAIFAPVWTLLYLAMAIAAWLVWEQRDSEEVALPLSLFAIQLILNVAWSAIFFGLHSTGGGAIEIVVLWFAITATWLAFRRATAFASWLLLPYLGWVTFAAALNFAVWQLNHSL